jgi:5'-deoxynucleotidase YfbR-like HD superfamily hydrolase
MALVHDMAERLVGDITPLHKDHQGRKVPEEEATMGYIAQLLPGVTDINNTFTTLFREYEEN